MQRFAPWAVALTLVAACATGPRIPGSGSSPEAEFGAWGVETSGFSPTIDPGDDFYRYVNAGWLRTATIPAGFPRRDSFVNAYLRTEEQLKDLFTDILASEREPGSPEQQVGALYRSYADVPRLNELGLAPIQPEIDAILAIRTRDEVARTMARPFNGSIAGVGVDSDAGNPQRYIVGIWQSGLGLPTPEFYLRGDEPFPGHRAAYRDYIEGVFRRAGIGDARVRAARVVALETDMARVHWSPAELRDPIRMYHPMTTAELSRFAPGFDWRAFLDEAGYGAQTELVVATDTAIQRLAPLFAETPVETWRSYLLFHTIDQRAALLSEEWQDAKFDFFERRLNGIGKRRPLEMRAVQFVSELLGELVGRAYAERYFPPAHRAQLQRMVGFVRAAYGERLRTLAWMDAETRAGAVVKLDRIVARIGYPDRWHDFSTLRIDPADLVGNVRRRAAWDKADDLAKLQEPRRDWEWPYYPQVVNAGYRPSDNSVTFPAAILQPPFFDPHADAAVNFGSIAAVIGHEIGHAFDDQGSRYDGDGRLRNWWTAASRKQFQERTGVLVAQYDAFSPIEGMHVNGRLTLGENIGDLGGLSIALDAYHRFVAEEQGGSAPAIDGFSSDQRFFLAWAQLWREVQTPDDARGRLLYDPHSPNQFRANGVVRNMDAWYAAFDVTEDDALYLAPADRVWIW